MIDENHRSVDDIPDALIIDTASVQRYAALVPLHAPGGGIEHHPPHPGRYRHIARNQLVLLFHIAVVGFATVLDKGS